MEATAAKATATKGRRAGGSMGGSVKRRRAREEHGWRMYDGAQLGRTDGWVTTGSDANAEIQGSLIRLRDRARDICRNNAWGKRIVDILVGALVGSGIRPTLDANDQTDEVYRLWKALSKRIYTGGNRGTVYTMQSLIARSWFESGEVFIRFRPRYPKDMPGLPPMQVQVMESDLCPVDKNETLSNGNTIVSGIEFNRYGERVAYHFYTAHPGAAWQVTGSLSTYDTVRVPADSIIHLMQELRPGQVRGIPWLAPVMIALWDLGGTGEAFRTNVKANSTLCAIVENGDPETPPDGIANEEDEDTGAVLEDEDGNPIEALTPGLVAYLQGGKKITFHSPMIATGYKEHVEAALHELAAGTGVSFHILNAGDLSTANFAQAKLGLIQQAQMIDGLRDLVFAPVVLDTLWSWFIDTATLANLLEDDPALYDVRWSRPVQQAADRLDQVKAGQAEMRAGFRSRREIIESDYSRDPDDVDAEIREDKVNRAGNPNDPKRPAIVSEGDPSQVTTSGSAQPSPTT